MSEKIIENNRVVVIGKIISEFTFSHEVFGEGFYTVNVSVNRLSDQVDVIPLLISERLINVKEDYTGRTVEATGQFRSYNRHDGVKNKLVLSVFVREISFREEFTDYTKTNQIYLDGFICKAPIYRKTPLGREIADLLVAVNRPYGKSDYIPCIAWGRNARFAQNFEIGTHIRLWGRIQSREYSKKFGENEVEKRIAYEISINKLECVDGDTEPVVNEIHEEHHEYGAYSTEPTAEPVTEQAASTDSYAAEVNETPESDI